MWSSRLDCISRVTSSGVFVYEYPGFVGAADDFFGDQATPFGDDARCHVAGCVGECQGEGALVRFGVFRVGGHGLA